jgi:3-vinyl bacteriochlorophyllide hydratase
MILALAAYATYVVNATQFLLKLRAARLDAAARSTPGGITAGGAAA